MLDQAKPLSVYFIRHGQTDWNAEERLQGQLDIPLNDLGRAQARRNGRALRDMLADPRALDYVASPLARCRETMEIVRAELALPRRGYRVEPALKEIHFGDWQGFTWDELKALNAGAIEARFADAWNTVSPGAGGESYAQLSARAVAWFASVTRDTVVVAHGGVKRCLRGHVEDLDRADIPHLAAPQDKIMVIKSGAVAWV